MNSWKEPKNTSTHHWTNHVKAKMRHYGLSEQKIRNVIKRPERTEEGIAENTVAVMQPQSKRRNKETGEKEWSAEIWVMYQLGAKQEVDLDVPEALRGIFKGKRKIKVISAWRYPAVTDPGEGLPEEILREINEAL